MNTEELNKPLPQERVKKFGNNVGAKSGLSYLEGHDVIRELNRVFDFKWSRDTKVQHQTTGEGRNNTVIVGYLGEAVLRVEIDGEYVVRHGIGFGVGISKNEADAHELAAKEAETDATKRAAMTLGDRFGLALYDKEQKNVLKPRDVNQEKVQAVARVSESLGISVEEAVNLIRAELGDTDFATIEDPDAWVNSLIERNNA